MATAVTKTMDRCRAKPRPMNAAARRGVVKYPKKEATDCLMTVTSLPVQFGEQEVADQPSQ